MYWDELIFASLWTITTTALDISRILPRDYRVYLRSDIALKEDADADGQCPGLQSGLDYLNYLYVLKFDYRMARRSFVQHFLTNDIILVKVLSLRSCSQYCLRYVVFQLCETSLVDASLV